MKRALREQKKLKYLIGKHCLEHGPKETAALFACSTNQAKYWRRKMVDPYYHPLPWGGKRKQAYSPEVEKLIKGLIWERCKRDPRTTLGEYISMLREYDIFISKRYLQRLFSRWRWTWKKTRKIQIQKYTRTNIDYYVEWMLAVSELPWIHLKFLDEAHCVGKDLSRARGLGPANEDIISIVKEKLGETFSMTLLLHLSDPDNPFGIDFRENSNTQYDFVEFVLHMLEAGRLVRGDYLIMDNASVHCGDDTFDLLRIVLDQAGVKIIFLPKYSPEFNPCELVFAKIKHLLRWYRDPSLPLWEQLVWSPTKTSCTFTGSAHSRSALKTDSPRRY